MTRLGKKFTPHLLAEHAVIGDEVYEPGERVWRVVEETKSKKLSALTPSGDRSSVVESCWYSLAAVDAQCEDDWRPS